MFQPEHILQPLRVPRASERVQLLFLCPVVNIQSMKLTEIWVKGLIELEKGK